MKRVVVGVLLATGLFGVSMTGLQLKTPTDWRWRTDSPATVTEVSGNLASGQWYYVGMPPGWHITTNPGVLLYNPAHGGQGNFTLESEIFLFPGDNQEEYGLFIGGQGLEPATAAATYTAFVARRDGQAAVLKRNGMVTTALVDWTVNPAVLAHPGGDATARNILKVEVGPAQVAFFANDKEITRVPRAEVVTSGAFGFRVGKAVNLHITTLNFTQRLAPVPAPK